MLQKIDEKTRQEIEVTKKTVSGVQGWLSDDEGAFLFLSAKEWPCSGEIVEIGSWKGRSTIWLAKGSKAGKRGKVHAIDPHVGSYENRNENTYRDFIRNLKKAGVTGHVVPMVARAEDAAKKWSKPIRLLWIDGSHDYEDVKRDFRIWEKFLVGGGMIALHDTVTREGPTKVSKEMIKSGKFSDVGFVDDITFAVKRKRSKTLAAASLFKRELVLKLLWMRYQPFRSLVKRAFFRRYT